MAWWITPLGKRLQKVKQSDEQRLHHGFQLCTARTPTREESQRLQALLQDERQAGSDETMAWRLVARVLLNLDETVTRE